LDDVSDPVWEKSEQKKEEIKPMTQNGRMEIAAKKIGD